jgi:RNA methyltransferase, TrmH family
MISSPNNPQIKQIRALRQRKEREQCGHCFIEGIRLVGEAVQLGADIEQLIVAPEILLSEFALELVEGQRRAGVEVLEVSRRVFAGLSQKDGPQGLGAVVRMRWQQLDDAQPAAGPGWVALDAVQDPGNLGSILRTADAVGCGGVILLGNSSDPYDPAALRGSMGAVFNQRLVRADFSELVAWARQQGYPLVGATAAAEQEYRAATYRTPLVLLMGSEREGLAPEQLAQCDLTVRIPMVGRSDSLNLAVATGVILYEIFAQQHNS